MVRTVPIIMVHHKPSASPLPLPSRPFCWIWHHRLLNPPPSSLILVRYYRLCPDMVQYLLNISLFLYSCLWFCIISQSPFLWRTPRLLIPILFNMRTTPLSTLISSRSLNQHLYADDTRICISFALKTFTTAISQLQDYFRHLILDDR